MVVEGKKSAPRLFELDPAPESYTSANLATLTSRDPLEPPAPPLSNKYGIGTLPSGCRSIARSFSSLPRPLRTPEDGTELELGSISKA